MKMMDIHDAMVAIGRLDAGRRLAETAGRSPQEILESLHATIAQSGLDSLYPDLVAALGLSPTDLPPWPPRELRDWDRTFDAIRQGIELVLATNSPLERGKARLDSHWRFALAAGYLLWTDLAEEAAGPFAESLRAIGIPDAEATAVIHGARSADTRTRLRCLARVREHVRERGQAHGL